MRVYHKYSYHTHEENSYVKRLICFLLMKFDEMYMYTYKQVVHIEIYHILVYMWYIYHMAFIY